ncbi:hypothetical protein DPMN_138669 [Dreissena polymorpha]|uniref:Uncharacterized protein n=1 Tax=Dreissena polymorpha TaxID=45954 RepID=A0A9D4G497_DREPO|nr:hypothetical protein DPMN_138669 [Dreissena polymorpha]
MARQTPTRLVMRPCIVEIDRIVIRYVQYQLEVNRCINEEVNEEIVARTDRRTDRRTDGGDNHNIHTLFKKRQDIIRTNVLTKFHEEMLTRINSQTPGGHVFQQTGTIFEMIQDIIKTNVVTKCHDDWTINATSYGRKNAPPRCGHIINVASRVLTIFIMKNALPPNGLFFQQTKTIFELLQYIIETNLLTRFHEDMKYMKNTPPHSGHVFHQTRIIFELIQDVIKTYVLTKVLMRKNAPPNGGQVFQPTGIIFELVQDINGTNLLTKFLKDRTINVASRVPWRPYFQAIMNIFKLVQDIIKANLLTKFHEDRTINVASKVLTKQMLTPFETRRTTHEARRTTS